MLLITDPIEEHNIQIVAHNRFKISRKDKITALYQQNNSTSSLQQMHKMTANAQIHGFQTRPLLAFSLFLICWPAPGGRDFDGLVVGWSAPGVPHCDEPDCGGAMCGGAHARLDCDEADSGGATTGPKCVGADCGGAPAAPDCDEAPVGSDCDGPPVGLDCDSVCCGRIGQ